MLLGLSLGSPLGEYDGVSLKPALDARLGDTLGLLLGEPDCALDGKEIDSLHGAADRLAEGTVQAVPEGLLDGEELGAPDGLPDGELGGASDGLPNGEPDGAPDGDAEGLAVGELEGGSDELLHGKYREKSRTARWTAKNLVRFMVKQMDLQMVSLMVH